MKIALIGASPMAKIIADKAKSMNVSTLCFAWAEGAEAKDYVDKFYDISIFEVERITKICKEECINAVIPTTELTLVIAAQIADALELPGNPVELMRMITKKNYVRSRLAEIDSIYKQPWFFYLKDQSEISNLKINRFPVIIKPASEGGKRGINVANDQGELIGYIDEAFAEDRFSNGVILEEYLDGGKEYSVEMLSYDGKHQGIQITEKIVSGPPHCVELGHSQPADLSNDLRTKVFDGAKELLSYIGYQNGAAHIEIKIINGIIYLIELNARIGGDHISYPLVELSTGYDYIGELINAAAGTKPSNYSDSKQQYFAGVRFVTKQTAYLKPLFDICESYSWCYKKHIESNELSELKGNNCNHTNYFIYCSDSVPKEIGIYSKSNV